MFPGIAVSVSLSVLHMIQVCLCVGCMYSSCDSSSSMSHADTFCVSAYLALSVVCRGEVTDLPRGLCVCVWESMGSYSG